MKGLGIEITIGVPAAVRRLEQERDGLRVQLAAEARRVRARAEKAEQERDHLRKEWDAHEAQIRRQAQVAAETILALTTERDEAWSRWRKIQGALQTTREDLAGVVEEVLAERDAAQARVTELLAEAQMLRRRVEEAENTREDHLLRCDAAARDGAARAAAEQERADKAERARDGWRGRALAWQGVAGAFRHATTYEESGQSYDDHHPLLEKAQDAFNAASNYETFFGRRCPGCRGCNAGATAADVCGGSRWVAKVPAADIEHEIEASFWAFDAERKKTGAERDAYKGQMRALAGSAVDPVPSQPDPEIPLTAMRRERDEALAGVAKLAQAARAFVACFDWHAGQIFLARTGTESEAVEALRALRYALPAPPLAPLGTAPGGYEAESADEDTTEPTPEEMPRAPTARSPEKPDA